ncbi:putative xylitol oxidase [Paenibacillus sp. J31TS4]|uniref:FAD-binding protein n=1 Tax=Paenibacillus sp. J31TS4 TaxID=2807195 RepID=UPI001B003317|nr:FAD-binding protein [Paenibacillus sp. J31TS4]GIP38205.1 putative xylitol oxidase [Paenibacillus sp. J31TS4]
MQEMRNWAGNYQYSAAELFEPERMEQLQEWVAKRHKIRPLGSRHSFNGIADTSGSLVSLKKMNQVLELDRSSGTVTVEGGIRYGELASYLHANNYALHNLASLPHITIAGACATGTHGSGDRNGNLATSVRSVEIVASTGDAIIFTRGEQPEADGAIVSLGALGVVTKLTLDIVPSFAISQLLFENLALSRLESQFDDVFSSAYSVSLFTDWSSDRFNQVWLKRLASVDDTFVEDDFYGATRATVPLHPVPDISAEPCSEQLGKRGPWHERLPHFRMAFTPSAGEELQSEYLVPRSHAYAALEAIFKLRDRIAPHLYISEVRTIAADQLWMSPNYRRDSIGIHFTWKPHSEAVERVLPLIEAALDPYEARPHWGKLFTMAPERLKSLYEKHSDFLSLAASCDPQGKFRNSFLDRYLW